MLEELDQFLAHERGHRARFGEQLTRRGQRRCRSYFWCGLGGFVLGAVTGLAGRNAIAATTVAIERVVLRHMEAQVEELAGVDEEAASALRQIIVEEREHHDLSVARLSPRGIWPKILDPVVGASTHVVIWLGMRL